MSGGEMSTWREMIEVEARDTGDDIAGLVVYPETVLWPIGYYDDEPLEGATQQPTLDVQFDNGYGLIDGPNFTAWSERRVYFPVDYDGSEWVASVPRNPAEVATKHVGGGG